MKLVLISDTHGLHDRVQIPDGDVLVHAGDICNIGKIWEAQAGLDWLNKQMHKRIVLIAGNHDFAFERAYTKDKLDFGRIDYLENSSVNIDGKLFWGSPYTPEFMNWAFNVPRGQLHKHWDTIPERLDVLITHGPPRGILDQSAPHLNSEYLGDDELVTAIQRVQPTIHVFGHIHGGYGKFETENTKFFNASQVNEAYRVVNRPWEVEI